MLAPLKWDAQLSTQAQSWAKRCSHNNEEGPNANSLIKTYSTSVDVVVSDWASERRNFNHATGMCVKGGECEHYRRMTSQSVQWLGCGVAYCNTDLPLDGVHGGWSIWICIYT